MLTILGWVGSNMVQKRRWKDRLRLRARLRLGRQEPRCGRRTPTGCRRHAGPRLLGPARHLRPTSKSTTPMPWPTRCSRRFTPSRASGRPKPTSWRRCRGLQTPDQPDPPSSGYAWPPSTRRRRSRRAAGRRHLPPARRPRHLSGEPGDGGATLQLVGPEIGLTLLALPGTPCHHAFDDSV
jgi:hypothetical protein